MNYSLKLKLIIFLFLKSLNKIVISLRFIIVFILTLNYIILNEISQNDNNNEEINIKTFTFYII